MSDRKYRQRGYQDDDRGASRERRPTPPVERDPGPRGRGLGKPTASVFRCAVCGLSQSSAIAAESVCGKCGADLHTCTHCAHFDTSAPNECRRPVTQYVPSKAKRNRCELFAPKAVQEFARDAESPSSAKAAFDALFKI
jgi:hypothetical protein